MSTMPKKPKKKPLKSRFEIQQQTPLPDNLTDDTLLTRGQAAVYAKCSARTIATCIKERGLREVRVGRCSRIRKGELDQFLHGGVEQPATPVEPTSIFLEDTEESIRETEEYRKAWLKMWGVQKIHTFGLDFESDMKYLKEEP